MTPLYKGGNLPPRRKTVGGSQYQFLMKYDFFYVNSE
jgi:hypothetical protein